MIEVFLGTFDKVFSLLEDFRELAFSKICKSLFVDFSGAMTFLQLCCGLAMKPSYYMPGIMGQLDSLQSNFD